MRAGCIIVTGVQCGEAWECRSLTVVDSGFVLSCQQGASKARSRILMTSSCASGPERVSAGTRIQRSNQKPSRNLVSKSPSLQRDAAQSHAPTAKQLFILFTCLGKPILVG